MITSLTDPCSLDGEGEDYTALEKTFHCTSGPAPEHPSAEKFNYHNLGLDTNHANL